jgi:hypothetical protein
VDEGEDKNRKENKSMSGFLEKMNAGETGAEDGYACCKMVLKNELGDIFGENNPSSVPTSTKPKEKEGEKKKYRL